jgi:hypothetical protein
MDSLYQLPDDDEAADERLTTSDARLRANRANAKKSTGPRTEEGKQRSSINALVHGGYARSRRALTWGPLGEDAEEVDAFFEAILDRLDPRDQAEYTQATRVAELLLCERRFAGYENAMLAEAHLLTLEERLSIGGNDDEPEATLMVLEWIDHWNSARDHSQMDEIADGDGMLVSPDPVFTGVDASFEYMTKLLQRELGPKTIKGVLDKTNTPTTPSEWRHAFKILVAHHFTDANNLKFWTHETRLSEAYKLHTARTRAAKLAAARAITQIERSTDTGMKISRELRNTMHFYTWLREQPHPDENTDDNEPDDETP